MGWHLYQHYKEIEQNLSFEINHEFLLDIPLAQIDINFNLEMKQNIISHDILFYEKIFSFHNFKSTTVH